MGSCSEATRNSDPSPDSPSAAAATAKLICFIAVPGGPSNSRTAGIPRCVRQNSELSASTPVSPRLGYERATPRGKPGGLSTKWCESEVLDLFQALVRGRKDGRDQEGEAHDLRHVCQGTPRTGIGGQRSPIWLACHGQVSRPGCQAVNRERCQIHDSLPDTQRRHNPLQQTS